MESTNQYMAFKPTVMMRLFPRRHLSTPDGPEWDSGYLTVQTVVGFDWLDRLRVLVSGKCLVTTKTATDVPVAKAQSVSSVAVLPPTFRVGVDAS